MRTRSTGVDLAPIPPKLTDSSKWRWPNVEGLHSFAGRLCHTAVYDNSIELEGKRVAVIGIGSTGLQVVPAIAPKVEHRYTFVRSPTWVTPVLAQKYSGPGGTNFACNIDPFLSGNK